MLTADLFQGVAYRSEEVGVGVEDGAVGGESDDSLRAVECGELAVQVQASVFCAVMSVASLTILTTRPARSRTGL